MLANHGRRPRLPALSTLENTMTSIYRFAGRNIEITSLLHDIHTLCRDYRSNGILDFVVSTTPSNIDCEREKSAREDALEGIPVRRFSDAYLETLAVYRKVAERMLEYDTFLFHGSCVAVGGASYLFTAKSGTGKSTHTRLWRVLLGERAVMVNDDKPLIRLTRDEAIAYGTPWDGKHHLSNNIAVPLKAVCILERSSENHIREITFSEELPMLLQQVYRPMNAAAMEKTLQLIDRLAGHVKLYRLGCNMDVSAAELSYNTMKG